MVTEPTCLPSNHLFLSYSRFSPLFFTVLLSHCSMIDAGSFMSLPQCLLCLALPPPTAGRGSLAQHFPESHSLSALG